MKIWNALMMTASIGTLVGCAVVVSDAEYAKRAGEMMRASFKERGQAKLDRLNQDEAQALCSRAPADGPLPKDAAARIEQVNLASVKFPADGMVLGDWREGEKIAQSGQGKQFNDNPATPAGANCYACHQISPQELSFGTIGPTLLGYGKVRGNSTDVQRYTYAKIYNPQGYTACSNMPRFGHNDILTEAQLKHVVALLLDPASPVNK